MKLLPLIPILSLSIACVNAADSKPKTVLAQPGSVIFSDDLTKAPDGKEWKAAKGKWEVADGALRGAELAADKHGAVSRHTMNFKDAVVQYEVKLDGTKSTTLSINDAKGHNSRIALSPTGFTVTKDDHDHEGPDKAVNFGRRAVDLKPGEWHTVRLELVGDTVLGTVDDAPPVFGSNEMIAAEKTNFGFTVAGESASFRNLKIWSATPNPGWEKAKASIPAATPPAAPAKRKAPAKKK
jgi:hypothetical protein